MGDILRSPVTGNALLLVPRSGSHSISAAALEQWWPEGYSAWMAAERGHPAQFFGDQESLNSQSQRESLAVVVRNPVERFRSLCAHRQLDVDEQLADPMYGPLPPGPFVHYFKFETDLDAAAEWLGLPLPLRLEDASDEADKPLLTPEQEARVREIYADDIDLWESL